MYYEVTMKIEANYTVSVDAESMSEAMKIAENVLNNADFGRAVSGVKIKKAMIVAEE